MGMLDNIDDKAKGVMTDPTKRARIEQIAQEKGMSLDEAKKHFMQHENK